MSQHEEHHSEPRLKKKQVFESTPNEETQWQGEAQSQADDLTLKQAFSSQESFAPVSIDDEVEADEAIEKLENLRPKKRTSRWVTVLLTVFAGLVGWQAVDSLYSAIQAGDWLTLGWTGFVAALAGLGVTALGKELWKLRRLRHHFSVQEQSQALLEANSVGQAKAFCEQLAKQSGLDHKSPDFQRWQEAVTQSHSDAEILELFDALVIAEQDRRAKAIVTQHATESAALVAISPLAIADMALVAWRNFKMVDKLAAVYGVELGYWSRLTLFKATLVNMAAAGASELAVDASIDLMSMDLAGRLSARAGQGLGVGILTARLGIKAMGLLRPLPWLAGKQVRLGEIRKQIVEKVVALSVK